MGLGSLFKKKPKRLIFFGPVIIEYPPKLRALAKDPFVFNLLKEADSLVKEQLGWSVLARLENERLPTTFVHEDYILNECLYQFCVFEKLKHHQFRYDHVAGFSLGEVATQLATGCYSFSESVSICCGITEGLRFPRDADLITIFASTTEVEHLIAAHGIACYSAINNGTRSVWSGLVSELNRLEETLKAGSIKSQRLFLHCASHSPLLDKALIEQRLSWCRPRKAIHPSYSSGVGGLLRNRPDAVHWAKMITQPSLANEMLKALAQPRYNEIICIGSLRSKADDRSLLSRAAPGTTLWDAAELLESL